MIDDDYLLFDGRQTITLLDDDGDQLTTVAGTTSGQLTKRQVQQLGPALAVEDEAKAFSLPVATLAGNVPQQGYTIVDASSVRWSVLSAEKRTFGTRWFCTCVKVRSEFQLARLVFTFDGNGDAPTDGELSNDTSGPTLYVSKKNRDGVSIESQITAITAGSIIKAVANDGTQWPGVGKTATVSSVGSVGNFKTIAFSGTGLPNPIATFSAGAVVTLIIAEAP